MAHPLFLAGFRPFFLLAFASGALLPLAWALVFSGRLGWPASAPDPMRWHAHEMLFGFGWAVLGGFLLTASKNWVKIRGLHGAPLALAAALWLVERVAVFFAGARSLPALALVNAFGLFVIAYLVWTLVRWRHQDSFRDNWIFVVALPVFLVAKNLLLAPATFALGSAMTIGLFRVAFAVMFERTIPQFMKAGSGPALPLRAWLDMPIKVLVLGSVLAPVLPPAVGSALLGLAALLLLARFFTWKPLVALGRADVWMMYVGYLGLVVHLALESLRVAGVTVGTGTVATHTFTFLCMGLVIPAMLVRICQGHTGRKPAYTRTDTFALLLMLGAAFLRLVATQLWPAQYALWVSLAAIGWSACFVVLAVRLAPMLWQPRIDGREH